MKFICLVIFLLSCFTAFVCGVEHDECSQANLEESVNTVPEACPVSEDCPRDSHPIGTPCPHDPH